MNHILIISLGNSPEPVVNCINSLRPDRAVFVCSDGTRHLVDAVLSRARLSSFDPERDVMQLQQRLKRKQDASVINELDQLDRVYERARELIHMLRDEAPGARLTLDYTGGTKTMAAGLAMAAVDDGRVELSVTTSERNKDQATISGYSVPVPVSMAAIQAYRLLDQDLPQLLKRYDYAAAEQAVQRIARLPDQDVETRATLQRLASVLVALDAWDRFDHRQAVGVLEGLGDRSLDQQLLFPLKRVIASRRCLDREAEAENWPQMRGGHGFEAVEDLLNNAERRACQERFDDAVGRLYRAMELAAQLALKLGHQLETGAIDVEKLPESLREKYALKQEQQGETALKLGLRASYDLLAELEDPVGICWIERRQKLLDALNTRNTSLFAHGFRSVDYSAWMPFRDVLGGFLKDVVVIQNTGQRCSELPQLPSRLDQLLQADD